jgi:hypothetical protein
MRLGKKIITIGLLTFTGWFATASVAAPYVGLQVGRANSGSNWQIAGNVHFGYRLMKYLSGEMMYGEYAAHNNLIMAQGKVIVPLSGLVTGVGMNLFGTLGGGMVTQAAASSIAATYGAGMETMFSSKVGVSLAWQHINKSNKTSGYDFFGLGVDLSFS